MKKLLSILIFISPNMWAAEPLPASCLEMLAIHKQIFHLKTEHHPEQKEAFRQQWLAVVELESLWAEMEKLTVTKEAHPELQAAAEKIRQLATTEITTICERGLEKAQQDFKQLKAELTGEL